MLVFEIFVGDRNYNWHQVSDTFDPCLVGLEDSISSILGKVADPNF